ncbi:GH36-type glycosyl hydrolase domain-containing protein [Desulfogranum japonicum]|uniref:GH36-type glycosyl hydrolase domain-containing protein n=1 Tax=Desulfogranum japonicum TaxID=231447 RepID=UPI0003FE7BA8|nr:glucoamylase family protein [Desulfogranum japonicum]
MILTTLIGYYANKDEARLAFQGLAARGHRRIVLLHKGTDGRTRQTRPSFFQRTPSRLFVALLCAIVTAAVPNVFLWFKPDAAETFHGLPFYLSACTFLLLTGVIWLQSRKGGIDAGIVAEHQDWLIRGESVLILQAPVESLHSSVAFLRRKSDIPPSLFILHPRHERRATTRKTGALSAPTQIVEHAFNYASKQRIDSRLHCGAELITRLRKSNKWVKAACADLAAARRLEQKATLAADWILDNEYILERNARDVLRNLPLRYFRQLPVLASDPYRGMPYIYGLAKDLVSHTELYLDRENILAFIRAYQTDHALTIGELWAVPQMLRIALIESIQNMVIVAMEDLRQRQLADFWANRLFAANQQDANTLFSVLAELSRKEAVPTPYFSIQLAGLLYNDPSALSPVQDWLERVHKKPLHDLTLQEQKRQTREQLSCGNAFTSLRQLTLLDWREMFELLSKVELILCTDPSGTYSMMDFTTRDRCRQAIEKLAKNSAQSEEQIASRVTGLAAQSAEQSSDELRGHVSFWLIGAGRDELASLLSCRDSLRHRILSWIYNHHSPGYLLTITASLILFTGFIVDSALPYELFSPRFVSSGTGILFVLLATITASQLAIEIVNYLITRFLPPRYLPKMDFQQSGIPDEFRTLVVVPVMLVDEKSIDGEIEKLEIRYLANRENNLSFSLFTDYTDSETPGRDNDAPLLQRAVAAIEALNNRHDDTTFFLFHRDRLWSESEQKYIGWERKRGKLEELNSLIDGTRNESAPPLVHVGDPMQLADIRFIITLDSDTRLPHSTARRMVETLAHPHNRPRFDTTGAVREGSYTIIQPRVSPTLESTNRSLFSRLFSDPVGIDPYSTAIADIYQDLSGEGNYHGKGIYDVRSFNRLLSGRFPAERILSHDLIEGAYVRVGLATDIELFDDFPSNYQAYSNRAHRWVRGDWQIASWIFSHVPGPAGTNRKNPLSAFNRWKILDNLRRSLVPAATVGLLAVSWFISSKAAGIATMVVLLLLLFQPISHYFTMVTSGKSLRHVSPAKLLHKLLQAAAAAILLPSQAAVLQDAAFRALYRFLVSKRNLLEWKSGDTGISASWWKSFHALTCVFGSIASVVVGIAVWQVRPATLVWAIPWLTVWFCAPLLGLYLNREETNRQKKPLTDADNHFLRLVSRRTWRYFATFVGEKTNWLPPDNYQVAHQDSLAMRTSPTNIGLWMTSALGAYDSGYLTINQVLDSLSSTMETIDRLQQYRGHLLNWYDIDTLTPLEPRYVSTVDSGNMLGCLWTLEQGLDEMTQSLLLGANTLSGWTDTIELLEEEPAAARLYGDLKRLLAEHVGRRPALPAEVSGLIRLQRLLENRIDSASGTFIPDGLVEEQRQQMAAWTLNRKRYLTWIEILAEQSEEELALLGPGFLTALRHDLQHAPSLDALAHGRVETMTLLEKLDAASTDIPPALQAWRDRATEEFAKAQWLAGETLSQLRSLAASIGRLSAGMKMDFLYDRARKLFAIGYNVSTSCLDTSRYDLLASEARFGSFIAIAQGDVPLEHWFAMGRLYGAHGLKRVLLSWTGTMFEYLMPHLFQRSYPHSLLDKAACEAVSIQIGYGRKNNIPWGISESAYANLDLNKTYQYKAFGVPHLSLKGGSEDQLVVSPYAALLALSISPRETVKNIKMMAELGIFGAYGFFESMDFSRQAQRHGRRGIVVEAYMAHHQGMAFVALVNFLHGQPFCRRFHRDSRVRAFEPLLQERIPSHPPLHLIRTNHREQAMLGEDASSAKASIFTSSHVLSPRSLLLSNGEFSLMVTNNGGGYSQWKEFELSRWRSDQTCDTMGTFCYFYEPQGDHLWSASYQPVGTDAEDCSAEFTLDRAVFRRDHEDMHSEMEVIVSLEDNVEIRRITLINRSSRERTLDMTSYAELSMAPHNADRQHPAFNKLFIQTEALEKEQILLAKRRLRSTTDAPLVVAHRFLEEDGGDGSPASQGWQFETDRSRFIGRGHTPADPMGARQDLGSSEGFVLDPVLCIKQRLILKPGQRVRIVLLYAAGETREEVLLLMDKYSLSHAVERAMDFAWRSAQLQLQVLQIQPDEARRFQQLASHLLFPNRLLRAPARILQKNRKGQSGLWPYGISGDLPLALVVIGEVRDLSLVRQMLQAHTYWRMQGLSTDLLILNEEPAGYRRPLQERLEQMIQVYAPEAASERKGSVYLLQSGQIPEEDLVLLNAAAAVVLVANRGTLPQQLARAVEVVELAEKIESKSLPREVSAALPFMELHYFNSLGGFTQDGSEYAIYLGPDINTPAPWVNVMSNANFGTLVSESGAGFTWFGNSQRNRLTNWSNDPVLDPASEALYIRDEETGEFWSPTAAPIREQNAYRARHGAGYTVFEHNSHGIEQELRVFVPVDDDDGLPVKLQSLRLINSSPRLRRLSLTYYVELTLGENRESSQMHITTNWDENSHSIMARNYYHPDYPDRITFVSLSPQAESHSCDRTAFTGRNCSVAAPAAMESVELSGQSGAGLDPCAALRVTVELEPGEAKHITTMLGQSGSVEETNELILRFQSMTAVTEALEKTVSWWNALLGTIEVHTPELSVNLLVNRWLQYQSLSCRIWGRSGFYQSGGAFGFRDQLQDVMAFLHVRPEIARQQILLAARHQFKEGDVQHWWHEPSGAGIRSRISDDLLWLPHVVSRYVATTGDRDILAVEIPFLESPELAADEHEIFLTPTVSLERASLFEHCRRAVEHGLTQGPINGLPLMGTGDWNDGMNLVGAGGKGESVWLAWFLCDVLMGMSELAELVEMEDLRQDYLEKREELIRQIEKKGWDGNWYLRATFDDGSPLGSHLNREARIDSLSQSWAWLSGAAGPERAEVALESAWEHLVRQDDRVALLFTPPFDSAEPTPGYIRGYPPGVRENGGQYTHAALWMAMALARQGNGQRAVELLRLLNPIEHTRDTSGVWRYDVEPYVVAADVYWLPGKIGQGGWTWYTGSAAWMYRAWVEEVLGLQIRDNRMTLRPVFPDNWQGFMLRYRYGESVYEINVENPHACGCGVASVTLDGKPQNDGFILLEKHACKHHVLITMGSPQQWNEEVDRHHRSALPESHCETR